MNTTEGSWIESITLFQQIRDGDYNTAVALLDSSDDPSATLYGFARLIHTFLRAEDSRKLDHFTEVARRMQPPSAPPLILEKLPPLDQLTASAIALVADETQVIHIPNLIALDIHRLYIPEDYQAQCSHFQGKDVEVIFVDPHNCAETMRFAGTVCDGWVITIHKEI